MLVLDGKLVAQSQRMALRPKVADFTRTWGRPPHLTVVLVGQDPASQVYVRNKLKACADVGIHSTQVLIDQGVTEDNLLAQLRELNELDSVDGILVQLPLPKGLNSELVNEVLNPLKDVDGLTFQSMGHLAAGKPLVSPCTPKGIMNLLAHYKIPVKGAHAVVIGRSHIVGRPMSQLLLNADATVTVCHSKTKDLKAVTQLGDIVIVAAGQREFFGRDYFRKGAVVIDVGIHGSGTGKGICGDIRFAELEGWAHAATPVPGGVGPLTIATLLDNTLELAEKRMQQRKRS